MKNLLLMVALSVGVAGAAAPIAAQSNVDSLRRSARSAEMRYERTARWLAPGTWGGRGGTCDETVGRFCLMFDSTSKPPNRPERREVAEARERALAALRAFHAAVPGELAAAGPLVRLLVEARRSEEAVTAAEAFAATTEDSVWGDWLAGLALHAAGRDRAAAPRFQRALIRSSPAERERIASIDWLLSPSERKRVSRLTEGEREAYIERFWRLADPMWLTSENEVWVEHVARHVQARMLARVPRVTGMLSWGSDLDQLTVRYGVPIARERDQSSSELSFIEHFDTSSLAWSPEALLAEGIPPLAPGEAWPQKSPSARSGHAPPAIMTAVPLPHQLTRIPAGDSMRVRLDAQVDSGAIAEALLAAWPWRGGQEVGTRASVAGDSPVIRLEAVVPRDSLVYSVEVLEEHTRKLHHARYLLAPLLPAPVELSDVLLTEPMPDSGTASASAPALTSVSLARDQPLGARVVVAGVAAGEAVEVEVSFARADRPSVLGRATAWIGRRLGLAADARAPRVRWHTPMNPDGVVAVNLRAPGRPGLYVIRVAIRAAAGDANSRRLVRVVSES